jgi:hypothetical protein
MPHKEFVLLTAFIIVFWILSLLFCSELCYLMKLSQLRVLIKYKDGNLLLLDVELSLLLTGYRRTGGNTIQERFEEQRSLNL